jgi:hypothetical protein
MVGNRRSPGIDNSSMLSKLFYYCFKGSTLSKIYQSYQIMIQIVNTEQHYTQDINPA